MPILPRDLDALNDGSRMREIRRWFGDHLSLLVKGVLTFAPTFGISMVLGVSFGWATARSRLGRSWFPSPDSDIGGFWTAIGALASAAVAVVAVLPVWVAFRDRIYRRHYVRMQISAVLLGASTLLQARKTMAAPHPLGDSDYDSIDAALSQFNSEMLLLGWREVAAISTARALVRLHRSVAVEPGNIMEVCGRLDSYLSVACKALRGEYDYRKLDVHKEADREFEVEWERWCK